MQRQQLESVRQIVAQSGISRLRIMLAFQLSFIDANELLSFPGFLAETIVGDPVEPGGKARLPAKTPQIFVSPQKRLLREIVRERNIGPDELAKQTSDAGLMISHQLRKGVVIIIEKNAGDEVCIG